jgi:UDP-glucose 4-epimerase
VVDKLIEEGHYVVVVDNLFTGKKENINPNAVFYETDVRDKGNLERIFAEEKIEFVNHHAAQMSVPASVEDPQFDADVNVIGFLNILQNCVKYNVEKVVFISSGGAIYGDREDLPTPEDVEISPLSPYAITKFVSEHYLRFYNHHYGMNYTVLRYANVYGPRQIPHGEAGVVSIFINKLLRNETPALYAFPDDPDGMIRDYVYVKDVVNANRLALEKGDGEAINIGTEKGTTTGELLRTIQQIMGTDVEPTRGGARPGDIHKSTLAIQKAKKVLGWQPRYSLKEGLAETVEFFREKC